MIAANRFHLAETKLTPIDRGRQLLLLTRVLQQARKRTHGSVTRLLLQRDASHR
jgi:hypothetical protein